jgi:hypothetical protein
MLAKRLTTTDPAKQIDVEIDHAKGRGYYVEVREWTTQPDGARQTELMGGCEMAMVEKTAARYSAKREKELAANVEGLPEYRPTLQKLLDRRGLTLAAATVATAL